MRANKCRFYLSVLAVLVTAVYGLDRARAETSFSIPEYELPLHKYLAEKVNGPVEAYRVESFGDMPIKVYIDKAGETSILVEGPFPEPGDSVEPGKGPVYKDFGKTSYAQIVLKEPGIYRFIVRSQPGSYSKIFSTCADPSLVKCARPQMTNKELLTLLRNNGELDTALSFIENKINEMVANKFLRGILRKQFYEFVKLTKPGVHAVFDSFISTRTFSSALHFPSIDIKFLSYLRPVSDAIKGHAPKADEPVHGEILEMIRDLTVDRKLPEPMKNMPDVGGGDFPNYAMSRLQVAQSEVLAGVMSKLASNNGSSVTLNGSGPITSPEQLIAELIKTGHTVTVRDERTYAAFIDLASHGKYVKWPVWIKMNDRLPDGLRVATPMGHSQYVWLIRGPLINSKLMFYLGISGANFFSMPHTRPPWTGLRAGFTADSDHDKDMVLNTIRVASVYLRRTRIERDTVAKGRFADGYGYVGVCNDSTAVIEKMTRGTISVFPLGRSEKLDNAPRIGDGLDDVMRSLPHDIDNPPPLSELERRLFAAITFGSDEDESRPVPELAGSLVDPYLGEVLKSVTTIEMR